MVDGEFGCYGFVVGIKLHPPDVELLVGGLDRMGIWCGSSLEGCSKVFDGMELCGVLELMMLTGIFNNKLSPNSFSLCLHLHSPFPSISIIISPHIVFSAPSSCISQFVHSNLLS